MACSDYAAFLERKAQNGHLSGFKPSFMPAALFDFQQAVTEWNIRTGKSGYSEDSVESDNP
jgi:hypothetical protein